VVDLQNAVLSTKAYSFGAHATDHDQISPDFISRLPDSRDDLAGPPEQLFRDPQKISSLRHPQLWSGLCSCRTPGFPRLRIPCDLQECHLSPEVDHKLSNHLNDSGVLRVQRWTLVEMHGAEDVLYGYSVMLFKVLGHPDWSSASLKQYRGDWIAKQLADEALMISRQHNQIYLLTVYKVFELVCSW
jgi:hypothetical protein